MTAQPKEAPSEPLVLTHLADGVMHVTMNRGPQRNALSIALMTALEEALDRAAADAATRVVVIAGSGPGFCAGHDLKELRANPGEAFYRRTFEQCSRMMTKVVRLPKPVIARIHGIATAAGCQLVASCDLAIASDAAQFATPGVNIGLFCSTPMVALSRAVGRKTAMEMLLTGEMVPAARARELGLINRVVSAAELDQSIAALAQQIVSKSPLTLKIGKEAFYRQAEMGLDDAYAYAAEVMTRNMMARDAAEGIDAFIEKRHPTWCGA
ncbi:MAG: enoyl-CoA hydratase [Alphaproteobacteria bacterium]|nr:enoyl-CoA hydratase [Alphaproteobacteria bacterium]